jgi:hypothetical protein
MGKNCKNFEVEAFFFGIRIFFIILKYFIQMDSLYNILKIQAG